MEQLCILPPLLPAADDEDALTLGAVVGAMVTFITTQNTTYHNNSWSTYYYNNYYRNFNVTKLNNYYKDTLTVHYRTISTMPNSAVVGVTMVSAIVIVCVLFMFITPAEAEQPRAKPVPGGYYYCYAAPSQPWRTDTSKYVWNA